MNSCSKCNLCNTAFHQIQTVGSGECELLLVGDYPRQEDDVSGYPFSGSSYSFLWDLLNQVGVSYYATYVIRCIPIDSYSRRYVKPDSSIYENCMRNNLVKEIEDLKPKAILAFGQNALSALLGEESNLNDFRERSFPIKFGEFETKLLATYSPVYAASCENEMIYRRFIDDVV